MGCENTRWIEIYQDRLEDWTVVQCDGCEYLNKITTARDLL